ncbi:MAG: hypothetical protein WA996_05455 [Candidatus Promineifilaceae bacterium]
MEVLHREMGLTASEMSSRKIERSADASQGNHALSFTPSEQAHHQNGLRKRSPKRWAVVTVAELGKILAGSEEGPHQG